MSKTTLSMSTDQVASAVPPPHRQVLSPESLYSSSLSPSPDSHSSVSNPSDREANSSPECCLSDTSSLDNLYNTTLPKDPLLSATHVNDSVNVWNEEDLSLTSNHVSESDNYHTFSKNTEDGSSSAVMSPDSVGSRLCSGATYRRGSTENVFCSLSSEEMIIRTDRCYLEDHSLLISSLDESSMSLGAGPSALPTECHLLPDVFEEMTETVIEKNMGHMCFGLTVIEEMLPSEENDMTTSSPLIALPAENEGALLNPFVCETSPANCGKEAQIAGAQKEPLLCLTAAEQGDTCVHCPSVMLDTDNVIHTSTPVQSIGNMIPSTPSFSVSPYIENTGNPGHNKKMEIKKFPKSDFSSVNSKLVTRNESPLSVSGPASQLKASQVNVNNKHTEAQRGTTNRFNPTKLRSSTAIVSTTTNSLAPQSSGPTATGGQGQSGACPPGPNPAANKPASEVCSNASFAAEQAASCQAAETATAEHSGYQTCFSSSEISPDRSGPTDPKPIPKKGVLGKMEVASGSAVGQAEPSVPKMCPRCSSEISSLSSRPPREKSATARFPASFTTHKAQMSLGPTRTGNLRSNFLTKRALPTEAGNQPAKNSREVKKSSLVLESSEWSTTGASSDESKSTFRARPAPRHRRLAQLSQPLPASPRPSPLSSRLRQPALGRDDFKTSNAGTPHSKQKSSTVDKNKPMAASRQQQPTSQPTSQPSQRSGAPHVVPASVAKGGRKYQNVQQLRGLLAASNKRCEAVDIVLQRALAEMEELKASHESMKQERQQYEASLQELRVAHDQELQSLDASLSGRIEALTAMENRSKQLAEMSQKDSQTLYLEQERLKVVLRIKTKQLHWQEKKMLDIDKLTKKSVKMMRASRRART